MTEVYRTLRVAPSVRRVLAAPPEGLYSSCPLSAIKLLSSR